MSAPTVTVVVVNLDGGAHVLQCLQSIASARYPQDRLEVVVVDNGSIDGSAELIQDRFPNVAVTKAGRNLGFSAANNLAAQRSRADYMAFVNNDATLDPDWFEEATAAALSGDRQPAAVAS